MNTKWKQRIGRAALPICSVLGVLAAFGIVLAWFPKTWDAWNLPLQEIDAPAHYYFIRKLLHQGVGAATRLWPNDAYYPPLFHLLAAALVSLCNALHIRINIYAAFNIVWLATSGLVWPAGVSLWASYFTRKVDGGFVEGRRGRESSVRLASGFRNRESKPGKPWLRNPLSSRDAAPVSETVAVGGGEEGNEDEIVDSRSFSWRPFSCAMMLMVPVLAVASASHPFLMLVSGPLIAFGLATTLLPFWLYATLRLFDAIAGRCHILPWLIWTVLLGLLCIFAHPRIAFTWLLLMAPFMLVRLPWKAILGILAAVAVCAVAFFFYMIGHYHSSRYFDPSSWFHTYKPNRTVPDALRVLFTDNVGGVSGWFMAVTVVAALVVALGVVLRDIRSRLVMIRFDGRAGGEEAGNVSADTNVSMDTNVSVDANVSAGISEDGPLDDDKTSVVAQSGNGSAGISAAISAQPAADEVVGHDSGRFSARGRAVNTRFASPTRMMAKDAVSLVLAFVLVGLVYVCSTSLTGWFPNIVAAAWYRAETRPLTMIPFAIIPLLVFAACVLARFDKVVEGVGFGSWISRNGGKAVAMIVLAALAVSCQVGNSARQVLGQSLVSNTVLVGKPENEQLTHAKYDVLKQTVKLTGKDSLIVSDPLNGSMYGSAMFDANMLYPIYNAMHEKNGAIFSATEASFESGDPAKLTATTCPVDGKVAKYFLAMGPQAPSLQMFTFRQQYDTFHRQDLIDGYVKAGTLVKVRDFSSYGPYAKGWALYRIKCGQ
ncbi:hypothetical protein OZX64_00930 [Bifidobacterium sp. ESL0704]|nr:DUF6541 family protein [Bifidobacterium sp. ESL0704]WEV53098.1 hypothetical protein OZX64_00930 [Bifidobacterium sp. ESL0704]